MSGVRRGNASILNTRSAITGVPPQNLSPDTLYPRTCSPFSSSYYWRVVVRVCPVTIRCVQAYRRLAVIRPKTKIQSYRLLFGVLAVLVVSGPGCTATSGGYLAHLADGLAALERGKTQDGVNALGVALSIRPDHSLAHAALGYALLAGGWPKEAEEQFETACGIDSKCAAAIYGKGLASLGKRQFGQAASFFESAQKAEPENDMSGAIEYARAMVAPVGQWKAESGEPKDDARTSVEAYGLMREGRLADAGDLLKGMRESLVVPAAYTEPTGVTLRGVRVALGDSPGALMTFVQDSPIVFGSERCKPYKPGPADSGPRVVRGTIDLRADLARAKSVKLVSFLIDDRILGVTNCPPFQCSWDTTRWQNGTHTIKIVGVDDVGVTLSEKSAVVRVANPLKETPGTQDSETQSYWSRLWKLMRLRPSTIAIDYNLGVCEQAAGDRQAAIAALERVMAVKPDCLDTRSRLRGLYGSPAPIQDLHKVSPTMKVIALTFDDGPKPDTAKLLDALKAKNVRATFFVVGKQIEKYPELAKRTCEEGHEIQNHTYGHGDLELLSPVEIERQIFRNCAVARAVVGKSMRMMRPPGAHGAKRLREITQKFGIRQVFWTANCSKLEGTNKQKIASYVLSKASPGGIVLMHNLDRVTLQALPEIIDSLRRKGYEFVTLSELIELDRNRKG